MIHSILNTWTPVKSVSVNVVMTACHAFVTVLSIHKRPVVGHADISFPMKGWRGMVDWARSSEDRVTIPKNILSTGKPGESLKHASYLPPVK